MTSSRHTDQPDDNATVPALLPLSPYEPTRHEPPRPELANSPEQLSLDDLLNELTARQTPGSELPQLDNPRLHRLLTVLLEVHAGHRPAAQLGTWVTPLLQRLLRNRVRARGPRYTLHRVHTSRPAEHAIEACATARFRDRTLALTARFEHQRGRWSCTAFTVLQPGQPRMAR